jgi:hypothetical protein
MTTIFFFFIELDKELDGCGAQGSDPAWYRHVEPLWPVHAPPPNARGCAI